MERKRKKQLIAAGVLSVALLALVAGLTVAASMLKWSFAMDDGPFRGEPRESVPGRKADQVFEIDNGYKLEVYDREPGEPAPTVLLRDRDSSVKWCIYAIAWDKKTEVRSIRFREWKAYSPGERHVLGGVDWTFGKERALWILGENGVLEEYWYSW